MRINPFPAIAFAMLTALTITACAPNITPAPGAQATSTRTVAPVPTTTNLPPATSTPIALPTSTMAIGAATALPTSPSASISNSSTSTITQADNGRTINLQVGERFLLNLGDGLNWQVEIDDPTVVSRVPNVLTVKGSQGLFEAHKPGQATLAARGDAACRKAQPACMVPTFLFQLHIVVSSASGATPPSQNTVTYADNGKTITLHVGEQFLLKLGDQFNWQATVADPSIVSRVVNIAVVRGAQGVYEAKKTGETTLTGTGTAVCAPGQPCPQFAIAFTVRIVVR